MSTRNRSFRVFLKKNLPSCLCGYKFYDKYMRQLHDVSPHKAWTVFHQVFVDEFVNRGSSQKWTGVPFLNPMDCPCSPGSVILVRERSLRHILKRFPNVAYAAGLVTDFFPPELNTNPPVVACKEFVKGCSDRKQFRKVFQSKNKEKAVVITATGVTVYGVDGGLNKEETLLDLDNFDSTGFKSTSCYVVTKVLTVDSLKVEVTLNGDVFYEHTFTAGVPIGFQASKVRVLEDGQGLLKDMRPIKSKLPVFIMKRRTVQHFLNAFLPNQNKLGNAVGDAPAVVNWQEPTSLRSYRPNFLPRPERTHQTDMVYYYKTDDDLLKLIYGNKINIKRLDRNQQANLRNRIRAQRLSIMQQEAEMGTVENAESDGASSVTTTTSGSSDSGDDTSDDSDDESDESDDDAAADDDDDDDDGDAVAANSWSSADSVPTLTPVDI